eukprot:COSAG06_NODE_14002_length_1198_cov_1.442220_1_plen_28_part_10
MAFLYLVRLYPGAVFKAENARALQERRV